MGHRRVTLDREWIAVGVRIIRPTVERHDLILVDYYGVIVRDRRHIVRRDRPSETDRIDATGSHVQHGDNRVVCASSLQTDRSTDKAGIEIYVKTGWKVSSVILEVTALGIGCGNRQIDSLARNISLITWVGDYRWLIHIRHIQREAAHDRGEGFRTTLCTQRLGVTHGDFYRILPAVIVPRVKADDRSAIPIISKRGKIG